MNDHNVVITLAQAKTAIDAVRSNIREVFVGQNNVVDTALVALLSGGHLLLEGVPGLGKTLFVRALSQSLDVSFGRVQFTPDLMPADVLGHSMFDMKTNEFKVKRGPAFTNLLLADEINRAPAKTQSALLEVMQEQQITIDGESLRLESPFMVLATQNPLDQEGTYPLPEAELDRFMMKILLDYPEEAQELALLKLNTQAKSNESKVDELKAVMNAALIADIRELVSTVKVDDALYAYAVRIIRASRDFPGVLHGAGVRGSINLVKAAKAVAVMDGRDYATPDDIKSNAAAILRHRLILSADLELDGGSPERVVESILSTVDAPRQ